MPKEQSEAAVQDPLAESRSRLGQKYPAGQGLQLPLDVPPAREVSEYRALYLGSIPKPLPRATVEPGPIGGCSNAGHQDLVTPYLFCKPA